jgi:hypothetical protein
LLNARWTFWELSAAYKGASIAEEYNRHSADPSRCPARPADRFKSVILVMVDNNLRSYPAAGYYYLGEAHMRRDQKNDARRRCRISNGREAIVQFRAHL